MDRCSPQKPKSFSRALVFQDVLAENLERTDCQGGDDDGDDEAVSSAFFELANAPMIAYRINKITHKKQKVENSSVILKLGQDQDSACGQHTGGIVWETSVLLLNYLLSKKTEDHSFLNEKRILEVGAGCGLLGLGLAVASEAKEVVVTEARPVLTNLEANLKRNRNLIESPARACALDWTRVREDATAAKISAGWADVVLGTDVIFSPALVEPLLQTLDHVLARGDSVIYLCVQIRCAASHDKFFEEASHKFETTEVSSEELRGIPECSWGPPTGCHLFLLTRKPDAKKKKNDDSVSSCGKHKKKRKKASC